jgi:hypothetical protein
LHDLYYSEHGCWKCKRELIAGGSTPEEAAQEVLTPATEVELLPPRQLHPPGPAIPGVVTDFLKTAKLGNQSSFDILEVCLDLAAFLMEKNAAYGDSALDPVRVISTADPAEQIRVRIDDKLSRLLRGKAAGEDALKDLVGYWILLKVAEKRVKEG